MTGPVQVLVLGYDEPHFSGAALAEARRLEDAGLVRVVDVLAVRRDASGELDTLDLDGAPDGAVARALLEATTGEPAEATWSLTDTIPAGGTAVVVLLEHLWASALVAAISSSGGRPLDELWLGADDRATLDRLLAER